MQFDVQEMLAYGYLSDEEKSVWISEVDAYVSDIEESLKCATYLDYYFLRDSKYRRQNVSHLHTGSIAEQFGKPLMVFESFERQVSNSFPELRSDHDVMFVLEDVPVFSK